MYSTQTPVVRLYDALLAHDGDDACADVLEPWADGHPDEVRWPAAFRERTDNDWSAATGEALCRLYALFRVVSLSLLRLQSGRADGSDYPGPKVGVEGLRRFLERSGFHVPETVGFHPFFHEVLSVRESGEATAPVEVLDVRWPCFMLGDLLFCRAGVSVSAGRSHLVPEIAGSSKLYWTHRRKDRPHEDLSHGWGGRSQWSTPLRRDYRRAGRHHFNVDGRRRLDDPGADVRGLSAATLIELVRHRCLVRTRLDDSDLCPYPYSYVEAVGDRAARARS